MRTNGSGGPETDLGRDESVETPRTYTEEERKMFEEKLNSMSRAEYAAFIRDCAVDSVRDGFIIPFLNAMMSERRNMDVLLTSFKYKDFWEYRELMIETSKKNPGVDAEQVYRLARNESLLRGN